MLEFLKKMILFGSGLASLTREKIEETVAEIVKKGELSEKEGRELVLDLAEKSKRAKKELKEKMEKIVADTLNKLNIPTRKELDELKTKIERMEKAAEGKE